MRERGQGVPRVFCEALKISLFFFLSVNDIVVGRAKFPGTVRKKIKKQLDGVRMDYAKSQRS